MNERLLAKMAVADLKKVDVKRGKDGLMHGSDGSTYALGKEEPAVARVVKPDAPSRNNDFDINSLMPWLLAGGLGLVGHSVGSAMAGEPSPEQRRKETVWERVLRSLIPIGMGGLAGYGGYRLGEYLKTASDKTAQDGAVYGDSVFVPSDATNMFERVSGKAPAGDYKDYKDLFKAGIPKDREDATRESALKTIARNGSTAIAGAGLATWLPLRLYSGLKGSAQEEMNAGLENERMARQAAEDALYSQRMKEYNERVSRAANLEGELDSMANKAEDRVSEIQRQKPKAKSSIKTRDANLSAAVKNVNDTKKAKIEFQKDMIKNPIPTPERVTVARGAGYRAPAKGFWNRLGGKWLGPIARKISRYGAGGALTTLPFALWSNYQRRKRLDEYEKVLEDATKKINWDVSKSPASTNSVPAAAQLPQ